MHISFSSLFLCPHFFGIQLAKENHITPPLRAPSHESCHSVNSHFSFSVYLHSGEMINVNEKQGLEELIKIQIPQIILPPKSVQE